jgi:hypothetical protein
MVFRWMTVPVGENEAVVFVRRDFLRFEDPFGARALGLWGEFRVMDSLKYVALAALGYGGFADAVEQTLMAAPKCQAWSHDQDLLLLARAAQPRWHSALNTLGRFMIFIDGQLGVPIGAHARPARDR